MNARVTFEKYRDYYGKVAHYASIELGTAKELKHDKDCAEYITKNYRYKKLVMKNVVKILSGLTIGKVEYIGKDE